MKKIRLKWIVSFIATFGLLIFLHFSSILLPVESYIYFAFNKIMKQIYPVVIPIQETYNNQKIKINLVEENKKLKDKLQAFLVESARLKKIEEENSKLRQHLRFFKEKELNYVLANIISRQMFIDLEETKRDMIIDKGRKDGIIKNLVVIDEGVVIGKITKVEENISHITLITNSNCRLAVSATNADKTTGIVEGNLGLTVNMNFIPQVENVEIDDMIITSGLENNIPRGILIGEVADIDKKSNEIWQSAVIRPAAEFDDLIIVAVLLP